MAVKPGSIPDGWETTQLGIVCRRITTGKLDANEMVADGDYPFFTCARENYRIDTYAFDYEALLVSGNGANVGYVHYYNGKFNAYQRTYVISEFSADVQFLKLFLERNLRDRIRVEVNAGNTPYITMGTLAEMEVVLPKDKTEQRAIAEALSDVDELLGGLDRLIAKKRDLKQAAMQQLLTGQTRLPGFHGEWEVKTLEYSMDCLDGVRVPLNEAQRAAMRGDYPYCGANGVLDYVSSYVIDDDIILMAEDGGYFDEYGSRPIAYRMKGKCWVNNHAHILKAKPGFDQGFLFYSLVHKNILPFLASGTRAKLNKSEMNKIEVRLPKEQPEQTAIAEVLTDMDAEMAALEQRREKTRALKQAMMQELLTGKTRLV
jgi:type I restriction enzyme S subunit